MPEPTADQQLLSLDAALIAAHAAGDTEQLARLYREAARHFLAAGHGDEAAFFLTQAYVLSLDCGDWSSAAECHQKLVAMGRES